MEFRFGPASFESSVPRHHTQKFKVVIHDLTLSRSVSILNGTLPLLDQPAQAYQLRNWPIKLQHWRVKSRQTEKITALYRALLEYSITRTDSKSCLCISERGRLSGALLQVSYCIVRQRVNTGKGCLCFFSFSCWERNSVQPLRRVWRSEAQWKRECEGYWTFRSIKIIKITYLSPGWTSVHVYIIVQGVLDLESLSGLLTMRSSCNHR